MFKKWLDKAGLDNRATRTQWDVGLAWFRLRYLTPEGPTRCIKLLSRPQACGRVALYFRPDAAVSELYLGIPHIHVRLLQRMAADFNFSVKPRLPEVAVPAAQRLTAVSGLPWERPFMAHIVNENAFFAPVDAARSGHGQEPRAAAFLPLPATAGRGLSSWYLPPPSFGLAARPTWAEEPPPPHLAAAAPHPQRWLLGRSLSAVPLHVSGGVNLYGRQEAVADWLVQQVTQTVALDPANLVVIDGAGDLIPRLKRQVAVTRLLGERLVYADVDGAGLITGFNPLAAAPGETEAALVQRWQRWFREMDVDAKGVQLLPRARQEGVADIPGLRKWLKQVERRGHDASGLPGGRLMQAVSSLELALNRLTASRAMREWLEWPTNRLDILPAGAFFFACKGTGWDRRRLLRAVLLGAMQVAGVRLVVHGFPWQKGDEAAVAEMEQIIVSNGPLLPGGTVALTECRAEAAKTLANRFFRGDVCLREKLELLGRGEGLVMAGERVVWSTWQTAVAAASG